MGMPQDQLMQLIKSQQDSATPGGLPPPPEMGNGAGDAPPMSAPMSTPEPKMGNREAAMINVSMALDLLEQSLPALGSETPEGKSILQAIRTMTGLLGPKKEKTAELQPAEILQLLQTLPQAGGASPEAKAMAGAPAIPGMNPNPPPPVPGAPGGGPMPLSQPPMQPSM